MNHNQIIPSNQITPSEEVRAVGESEDSYDMPPFDAPGSFGLAEQLREGSSPEVDWAGYLACSNT